MKFPYIGKNKEGVEALIYSDSSAFLLCGMYSGGMHDVQVKNWFSRRYKNITAEYLTNTYGKVESKEHAEFIVKLAEVNNIRVAGEWIKDTLFCFSSDCEGKPFLSFYPERLAKSDNEKLITIPLPPKEESMESRKEWPQVGDEVSFPSGKGILVMGKPDVNGVIIVKSTNADSTGEYKKVSLDALKKPPTPQEKLTDEICNQIGSKDDSYALAKAIINGEIEGLEYKPQ